jgi:CspA family cold shock protein
MPWGRVKWFDSKKGYGFITLEDDKKDVFLHVSALEKSKLRKIRENQKIQFEIKEEQGKLQAINLKSKK